MARTTNMDKARQKRKEEREKEAARKAMFKKREETWKPKEGENHIRVLPPWTSDGPNGDQFWREVYTHFGVTDFEAPDADSAMRMACPKETPGAAELQGLEADSKMVCPICEAVAKLRQSQDPADIEMAKNSRAKTQIMSNIIDLDDPVWTQENINEKKAKNVSAEHLPKLGDPKVQVFTYGITIMNQILDFFQDGVDLTNLSEGRDLTLTREGTGIQTKYRTRPSMTASPAPITDAQLDEHLEDLDELAPFFTMEQMEASLSGATRQEVYALARKETEELEEGESSEPEATEKPEAAAELPPHEEEPEAEAKGDDWPPLDSDGDLDWAKIDDADIENPEHAKVEDKNGSAVHISCFGSARQIDVNDTDCSDDCGLFDRCKARNEQLDDEEEAAAKAAEEATAKKKGAGKKSAGKKGAGKKTAGKKTAGKEAAGKGNGASEKKAAPATTGGTEDDLEAEMKAALGK